MNKLLHLKHWQLLLPLMCIILIDLFFDNSITQIITEILALSSFIIYLVWIWISCINLCTKLPPNTNLNLKRFKLFMFISVLYIATMGLIFVYLSIKQIAVFGYIISYASIIYPIHVLCVFLVFWCLAFFAKVFKTVELQRIVTFSDYAKEFFLIAFYPIGIWFIQPRINKIFLGESTPN